MRFFYCGDFITLLGFTLALASEDHQTVTVKRSPTAPWLDVYRDGELTSEWQRSDGVVYEVLKTLLNDELGPATSRRRPRMHVGFLSYIVLM